MKGKQTTPLSLHSTAMIRNRINTITDWMLAVAEAATDGDVRELEQLEGISRGWLQTDAEANAQMALLQAIAQLMDDAGYHN